MILQQFGCKKYDERSIKLAETQQHNCESVESIPLADPQGSGGKETDLNQSGSVN
jgi:hypothetical protein